MSIAEEGGGASRSTDPAHGSSTATDVSLREHFEALRKADRDLDDALRRGDLEAVRTAFAAATELSKTHNDLLRRMEKLIETFATKESLDRRLEAYENRLKIIESGRSRIIGAVSVLGLIGVGTLVKLFGG